MNRKNAVNTQLKTHSLDGILVSSRINIQYLTGFTGASQTEREAFLLITPTFWHIFTYRLYEEEAKKVTKKNPSFVIHSITPEQSFSSQLAQVVQQEDISKLGIEPDSLSYREYERIKKALPHCALLPSTPWIENLRQIKTSQEIEKIITACKITDRCFDYIQTEIKKGKSERTLAWLIEQFIREQGYAIAFPPIVAYGMNGSIPHHTPRNDTTLTEHPTTILLDFGAAYEGYHADMTRILFYKKPKTEWVRAYTTLLNAQEHALSWLRATPDPSGSTLDSQTRSILTHAGYPEYPHSLGHGVGLEIHELPRLSMNQDMILTTGMVFSIEPGIYLPGKFGLRIEDLVVKTADGIQQLSTSTKKLIIIEK